MAINVYVPRWVCNVFLCGVVYGIKAVSIKSVIAREMMSDKMVQTGTLKFPKSWWGAVCMKLKVLS